MDAPTPLVPSNDLETALVAAKKGELPLREFLAKLLDSEIAVPSANEVLEGGYGLRPLLFERDGTPMVAIFSSRERAKLFEAQAPHALVIEARAFLSGLSTHAGVVLNPGYTEGLDISPEGIRNILRDFAPRP